jgi:hypothetical protein
LYEYDEKRVEGHYHPECIEKPDVFEKGTCFHLKLEHRWAQYKEVDFVSGGRD